MGVDGGAYATAQLSAAVIGPGVRDIREMRDIPDEGVSFSESLVRSRAILDVQ